MNNQEGPIAGHKRTIDIIRAHGLTVKKGYGQNFLTDPLVLSRIISAGELSKEDTVIEIGAGLGALTQALCDGAGQVIAFEIDKALKPALEQNLASCGNVELIFRDFLKYDLTSLELPQQAVKVYGNLPYYITTPIIQHLLTSGLNIERMVFMLQKEVASRLAARPGTKDYGSLTLFINYYADIELVANVPPNCFVPRPGVDSAVVRFNMLPTPRVSVPDSEFLFRMIRAAFATRRKTLVNCLSAALELEKPAVAAWLEACGLSTQIRGEELSLAEFASLCLLRPAQQT